MRVSQIPFNLRLFVCTHCFALKAWIIPLHVISTFDRIVKLYYRNSIQLSFFPFAHAFGTASTGGWGMSKYGNVT